MFGLAYGGSDANIVKDRFDRLDGVR